MNRENATDMNQTKTAGTDDMIIKSSLGKEMLVKDVMTCNVITVSKYDSVMNVADVLVKMNISGLPVVDRGKKLVGIITQADILSVLGIGRQHTLKDMLRKMIGESVPERRMGDVVGDIMTSPVYTITMDATVANAVSIMDDKKIRRLMVVNDKNELIGIITRADILKAVIRKIKQGC